MSKQAMSAGVSISLFILGILSISQPCQARLYNLTDEIVLLDNTTIKGVIYDSPVAWIIEFYSSWCGHCQAFAPTWKKLAQVVQDWKSVIRVAAIDCAEESNLDTCREFGIEAYPTIKFFNASTKNRNNLGKDFDNGDKTFLNLLHEIVRVVDYQDPKLLENPKPNFTPLHESELDEPSGEQKYQVLVFEKESSFVGKELALDMQLYPSVSLRRVLDTETALVDKYQITDFPAIVFIEKGYFRELSEGLPQSQRTHADFKRKLHRRLGKKLRKTFPEIPAAQRAYEHFAKLHGGPIAFHKLTGSSSDVYLKDMVSGLSYMLWNEIPMKKEIKGDALKALKNFFGLISECFPGSRTTSMLFRHLANKISSKLLTKLRSKDFLNIATTTNDMIEHDAPLPHKVEWQACQGSSPRYRGYPCTLWTLFHVLTVNCKKGDQNTPPGLRTLLHIREYIRHFFTCSYCVKHFTKMAEDIEDTVKSRDDAILWLWQAHNKANKRLHLDESEDPKFPKIQFPSDDICANCRDDQSQWKEHMVLKFLKDHYGKDNIRIKKHKKGPPELDDADLVRAQIPSTSRPHVITTVLTLGLNTYDTSLCLVVYTAIGVALIAGYLYFMRRKRGRPYKYHIHTP
ncbi:sulfhydryl oxidase 1 isoform X1 [Nematostella vectensis]|uniref:sulfhydryl oxidase 1 isoform X1 n=1 Tax=Nematostella vectensis TaxID=45351 RepID=UPI00138FC083|nr:sulfhydryl oxidase 1 isoform X1 [Nematostella vectensis]